MFARGGKQTNAQCFASGFIVAILLSLLPASAVAQLADPSLQFFEGRTEMTSLVKVVMKRPYKSVTVGDGRILHDGSLALVQNVRDEGRPPRTRYWKVRQTGAGHFTGTMSEAIGPVEAQQIGDAYRFRFKLKGHLTVEQWLKPLPGWRSAKSTATVRKFGIRVATSSGTIRHL